MLNNDFLQELSSRISALMPMAASVRADVEKSIQELLQSAFSRLNLVTREEFDAQMKVLERAEKTIATLEEKIAMLEKEQGLTQDPDRDNETQ